MKKDIFFYVSCLALAIVVIASVPGYLMQEADQVRFEEEVLLGDASMVEGVKITSHSHYGGNLFWDTEYVAGASPKAETKHVFSAKRKETYLRYSDHNRSYWYEEGGYRVLSLGSGLGGGWSVTSSGGLSINSANIQRRELEPAYEALAAETAPGEKKSRQICLSDYLEYFPVNITLDDNWVGKKKCDIEALDAAYAEFFKIPVPDGANYMIMVEKNEDGDMITLGGGDGGQSIYSWNMVCAASDTDLYFTFGRYSMSGAKLDTSQVPGGYGVYRQPYSIVGDELVFDTEKLSMVYSLEEEQYREGSVFLDVTEAGELLILTDQEETTRLQVVDLETMELLQKVELTRPEKCKGFDYVARIKEDFFVLGFHQGYFSLVSKEEGGGYAQQLLIDLEPDDPFYYHVYLNENDMEWNGEQLVFACYSGNRCNLELTVYDKTGKIYHGRYYSSLLTKQEYAERALGEKDNWYYECEPRTNVCLDVEWTK